MKLSLKPATMVEEDTAFAGQHGISRPVKKHLNNYCGTGKIRKKAATKRTEGHKLRRMCKSVCAHVKPLICAG
jgi:hypothetical protein